MVRDSSQSHSIGLTTSTLSPPSVFLAFAKSQIISSAQGHFSWVYRAVGFPGGSMEKSPACQNLLRNIQQIDDVSSEQLEKEMATHSSVLAWRIPGMEEPGGLPLSMGLHRVGHD